MSKLLEEKISVMIHSQRLGASNSFPRFAPFSDQHNCPFGVIYDALFNGSMVLKKIVDERCWGMADLVSLRGIVSAIASGAQEALDVVSLLVDAHAQEHLLLVVSDTQTAINNAIAAKERLEAKFQHVTVHLYVEKQTGEMLTGLFPIYLLRAESSIGAMELSADMYIPSERNLIIEGCPDFRFCQSKLRMIREMRPVAFIFLPGGTWNVSEKVEFFVEAERRMLEELSCELILTLGHEECAALKDLKLGSPKEEFTRQVALMKSADQVRSQAMKAQIPYVVGYEEIDGRRDFVSLTLINPGGGRLDAAA